MIEETVTDMCEASLSLGSILLVVGDVLSSISIVKTCSVILWNWKFLPLCAHCVFYRFSPTCGWCVCVFVGGPDSQHLLRHRAQRFPPAAAAHQGPPGGVGVHCHEPRRLGEGQHTSLCPGWVQTGGGGGFPSDIIQNSRVSLLLHEPFHIFYLCFFFMLLSMNPPIIPGTGRMPVPPLRLRRINVAHLEIGL